MVKKETRDIIRDISSGGEKMISTTELYQDRMNKFRIEAMKLCKWFRNINKRVTHYHKLTIQIFRFDRNIFLIFLYKAKEEK